MNWDNFFFALSGASAALIGVTFAFVVSKILSNISDYESIYSSSLDLSIDGSKIKNDFGNINYKWHDKMVLKYDYKLKEKIESGTYIGTTDAEITEYISNNVKRVYYPSHCVEYVKEVMKEVDDDINSRKIPCGENISLIQFPLIKIPDIPYDGFWKDLNAEEEIFRKASIDGSLLLERFNAISQRIDFHNNDLKFLRRMVLAFIVIITWTVIYPLHFIPLPPDTYPEISFSLSNFFALWFSIKGVLLTILFLAINGSLTFFYVMCLKYKRKFNDLKKYINDNYYDMTIFSELFVSTDDKENEENPDVK